MSNVEGPTSIILLTGLPSESEPREEPRGDGESIDYLRGRERAEKEAAARAQTGQARRVHQQLADRYARQIAQRES